jgi:hypothetical protein
MMPENKPIFPCSTHHILNHKTLLLVVLILIPLEVKSYTLLFYILIFFYLISILLFLFLKVHYLNRYYQSISAPYYNLYASQGRRSYHQIYKKILYIFLYIIINISSKMP